MQKFHKKPGYQYLLMFASFLVFSCYSALATEYYVRTSREITSAMNGAQPGDTLTMANGIWRNEDIDFYGKGTEDNPIVLRAETPGQVILTGKSRLDVNGSYLVIDGLYFLGGYMVYYKVHIIDFQNESHHCRLTNTAMVDCNPEDWGLFYKWVRVKGTYNRIDHCYFSGKNHQDVMIKFLIPENSSSYGRFDHNYVGDIREGKTGNGWEAILIQGQNIAEDEDKAGKVIVENNFFYHCDGEIEIISLKTGDNHIRRNTFYECKGTVTCRKKTGNYIYENFFIGNGVPATGGVRMYSKGHIVKNNYFEKLNGDSWRAAIALMNAQPGLPEVENVLVAFNTIVDCENSFTFGVGESESSGRIVPPRNIRLANNLALSNSDQLIKYLTDVNDIYYEGNIMYGADLGIRPPAGIDTVDPKLYLADDGLWRPESDSPLINNAEGDYPDVAFDMDGQGRDDGEKDIGGDEFSDVPIVNRPLTRNDVGPDWINSPDLPVALFITKKGSGSGDVMLNPAGGIYEVGTVVTLTALPGITSTFNGWGGDLTGTANPDSIIMDSNKRVTATFAGPPPR